MSDQPWPRTPPTEADRTRYRDAKVGSYWMEAAGATAVTTPVDGTVETDLCIVGGGFTGLWAALHAKGRDPARDVVLLEAATIGFGASGRNGGFAEASLTHGLANGLVRFADELATLQRLGDENFAGLRDDLSRYGVACDFEPSGTVSVATARHEVAWLREEAEAARRFGGEVTLLDREAMRAEVDSPIYLGGLWSRSGSALLDPARLALGLRDAALTAGVRVHEHSGATGLHERRSGAIDVTTAAGCVRARRVLLATSAFPPLLRRLRAYIAPVYDYVLTTEPLTPGQRASIGWGRRQGLGDMGNQFHYYRLTADDRILFGGYDAVYRYGGPVGANLDDHDETFATLSQHFATIFPQLGDVRFSHRWGGAIDTCSRFSVFFGTAHRGKVAYAVGYTGLGVAATRFGAAVALDLLDGRETEATRTAYVRSRPVPFPPEPLRTAVIQLTRNRLAAADAHAGRRGLWLRTLDRLKLGFDS